MNHERFLLYLNSDTWRAKRKDRLIHDSWTCCRCGKGLDNGHPHLELHVHHVTYARVGRERLDDLRTLCSQCHFARHHSLTWGEFMDLMKSRLEIVADGPGEWTEALKTFMPKANRRKLAGLGWRVLKMDRERRVVILAVRFPTEVLPQFPPLAE